MPHSSVVKYVYGLSEVKKALATLEPKLRNGVVRRASRDAIKIPAAMVKSTWPVDSGVSKKTIRVRTSKGPRGASKKSVSMALIVGRSNAPGWWAWLIEHGFHVGGKRVRSGGKTTGYEPNKSGGTVRKIAGRHLVRQALRSTEVEMNVQMTNAIVAGVEQLANRGGS
jgi:hypothetical protein